jgi:hypothetical protein
MPSKRLRDVLTKLASSEPQRPFDTIELSIDNARLIQRDEWLRLKERGAKRVVISR